MGDTVVLLRCFAKRVPEFAMAEPRRPCGSFGKWLRRGMAHAMPRGSEEHFAIDLIMA